MNNLMMALSSMVIFLVLWIPVELKPEATTVSPSSIWVSCDDCRKGFNATHNWRCRYGCDRYYKKRRGPVSITKPTPGTTDIHNTRKGSFLDCKKCFGFGKQITPDPRCKYGCGRYMTYPTITIKNRKPTETGTPNAEEENIIKTDTPNHEGTNSMKVLISTDRLSGAKVYLKYKHIFVLVGLGIIGLAACVAYLVYKRKWQPKRLKEEVAASPAAVVMQNL